MTVGINGRDVDIPHAFEELLEELRFYKPNDRSGEDRAFQILITDVEKAYAFYIGCWEAMKLSMNPGE